MYDKQTRIKFWGNVVFVAAVVLVCFFYLRLDGVGILTAAPTFVGYAAANFFPPAMGNINIYFSAALYTVAFAIVSTAVSAVLSVIFSLLMVEAIMPVAAVRWAVRFIMTFIRNIPVVIWASLLVMIFGIGSLVGLIALILATTGFLSRSYAESINEIAARKLEPMRASGAGTFAIIRHGLLPEFTPAWLNWTLFSFEISVRASAVLGMVGAGGMGAIIQTQLNLRRFNEVATMVLMLIAIILITEFAANFLRRKYMYSAASPESIIFPVRKEQKLRAYPLTLSLKKTIGMIGAVVLFIICLHYIDLDITRFVSRLPRVPQILRLLLDVNMDMILPGLRQFTVSFAMGVVGLVLGGLLALVLAFLAAENITPWKPLSVGIKAFVSVVRAVPSLIFVLMIVAAIGLGYTAGVVVLILSSMGYLTKAFVASIEEQPRGLVTAMRATGANWGQIVIHGLLPAVVTGFLSWVAIRLEASVAESITLGVVGAGGIGTMLMRAIRHLDYSSVTVLILIIFICMACLEWVANIVRRKVARM